MDRPTLIYDPHFRSTTELFTNPAFTQLNAMFNIVGDDVAPMSTDRLDSLLPDAQVLIAARPSLTADQIARAPNLRAIIEVSGAFHDGLAYDACFSHGIEVLSCAPGFRRAVAEMGLAMILASCRGLVAEHEAFRAGNEHWVDDCARCDMTLFGQRVGFVGYGNIAQALHNLLRPFGVRVSAFDPWRTDWPGDVERVSLDALFRDTPIVCVTAVPTADNRHMVNRALIDAMPPSARLIVLSRAHCVDMGAAFDAARAGRIHLATDVFEPEPTPMDDPIRTCPNAILSPHRAAAVPGGRQPIGDMIVADLCAMRDGYADRQLQRGTPTRIESLMAAQRAIAAGGQLSNT